MTLKTNLGQRPELATNSELSTNASQTSPKVGDNPLTGNANASTSPSLPSPMVIGAKNARLNVLRTIGPSAAGNAEKKHEESGSAMLKQAPTSDMPTTPAIETNPLRGNPLSFQDLEGLKGNFRNLTEDAFLEIIKHLDGDSIAKLVQAGGLAPLSDEDRKLLGRGELFQFSPKYLANAILPGIDELLRYSPKEEKALDAQVKAVASKIQAINTAKEQGVITEETALKQTVSALLENFNGGQKSAWVERVATTPLLATAVCELMSKLPSIMDSNGAADPRKFLVLFAKAINLEFTSADTSQFAGSAAFAKLANLKLERNLPIDIVSLFNAWRMDERIEHAERMKEGINGLLQAVPELRNRPSSRDYILAIEVLEMVHAYADTALKKKIAGELQKLTLDELSRNQESLPPHLTVFARERIIGDLHRMSTDDKRRFIRMIDLDLRMYDAGPKHSAPLLKNVRQLVAALPDLKDRNLSKEVSALAAQCLIKHQTMMDSETRLALLEVAQDGLAQMSFNATPKEKASILIKLAPVWNAALKQLKEQAHSMPEAQHKKIVTAFAAVDRLINDCHVDVQAAILSEYLDGIKSLGQVDMTPGTVTRFNALAAYLNRTYQPANDQERDAVLKARLALLNHPNRLITLLQNHHKASIPALERLFDDVDRAAPGVSFAAELNALTPRLDNARKFLQDSKKLNSDQKEAAAKLINDLEERIKRSAGNDQPVV